MRFAAETRCHIWVVQNLQRPDAKYMHEVVGGPDFLNEFDNGICVHRVKNSHMHRVKICVDKASNTSSDPLASVDLVYNRILHIPGAGCSSLIAITSNSEGECPVFRSHLCL